MTARFQCRECTCYFPGAGPVCEQCQRVIDDASLVNSLQIVVGGHYGFDEQTMEAIIERIRGVVDGRYDIRRG